LVLQARGMMSPDEVDAIPRTEAEEYSHSLLDPLDMKEEVHAEAPKKS